MTNVIKLPSKGIFIPLLNPEKILVLDENLVLVRSDLVIQPSLNLLDLKVGKLLMHLSFLDPQTDETLCITFVDDFRDLFDLDRLPALNVELSIKDLFEINEVDGLVREKLEYALLDYFFSSFTPSIEVSYDLGTGELEFETILTRKDRRQKISFSSSASLEHFSQVIQLKEGGV